MTIPLTVIGGFLGAGKTTLVNHLLRTATSRLGVLVNDFGALAIDAALIAGASNGIVSLTNGCVCCEGGEDLGAGLLTLAGRGVDHVIVEASGVGDPARLAQLALVEPGFALEPIVVVVDGIAIAAQLADRWVAGTVRAQILGADILILNKDRSGLPDIRALRPDVPVIETVFGAVDPALLRFPVPERSRFLADQPASRDFRSFSLLPPAPFDRERLRRVLLALPRSVLRIKGFCRLGPEASPHLLQFASGQWALTPADADQAPGLVMIGTAEMPEFEAIAGLFEAAMTGAAGQSMVASV